MRVSPLLSDSEVVYRNRDGDVIKFDFVLNETEVLLSNSIFVSIFTLLFIVKSQMLSHVAVPDLYILYIFRFSCYLIDARSSYYNSRFPTGNNKLSYSFF